MPDPTPVLSQERLYQLECEYMAGDFKSVSELARKYGIKENTLCVRAKREGWEEKRNQLLQKNSKKITEAIQNEANLWVNRVKERSLKDWKIIDKSIDELVGIQEDANGNVTLINGADPGAMRSYIQARKLLDDMARRCLGLQDAPKSLDLTSKGQSLGESLLSAISKIRANGGQSKISSEDVDRILEAEIIDDSDSQKPPL